MIRPFTVTIEEKRTKDVTINAVTVDEALDMVESLYRSGDFRLNAYNLKNVEFVCHEDILNEGEE